VLTDTWLPLSNMPGVLAHACDERMLARDAICWDRTTVRYHRRRLSDRSFPIRTRTERRVESGTDTRMTRTLLGTIRGHGSRRVPPRRIGLTATPPADHVSEKISRTSHRAPHEFLSRSSGETLYTSRVMRRQRLQPIAADPRKSGSAVRRLAVRVRSWPLVLENPASPYKSHQVERLPSGSAESRRALRPSRGDGSCAAILGA
jgi:hypothetical protein